MNLIDQTILHDPENGKYGNCFQAALATLLGLPLEEVPHFGDGGWRANAFEKVQEFLRPRGQALLPLTPMQVQHFKDFHLYRCYHLAEGFTDRFNGEVAHTVVYKNGELFHDPHPDKTGLKEADMFYILIALEQHK